VEYLNGLSVLNFLHFSCESQNAAFGSVEGVCVNHGYRTYGLLVTCGQRGHLTWPASEYSLPS